MDSENVHKLNTNINIQKKIFEYSNIFEYSLQHCHGVGDVGHHGPDQPHGRLRYGDAEVHCQDQQLHIYSHTQNIVLYVILMSKGQGFVLSEYLKSSLKKCEKSLSDIKYEISTVRHRTYLMKISHIGSSRRWLSDPAGQDLDYFKANVIELLLE